MDKRPAFDELTEVSLTHAVEVEGFVMPSGTTGVVMAAYADGLAYAPPRGLDAGGKGYLPSEGARA